MEIIIAILILMIEYDNLTLIIITIIIILCPGLVFKLNSTFIYNPSILAESCKKTEAQYVHSLVQSHTSRK